MFIDLHVFFLPELVGLFVLPCTVSWLWERPLNNNLVFDLQVFSFCEQFFFLI